MRNQGLGSSLPSFPPGFSSPKEVHSLQNGRNVPVFGLWSALPPFCSCGGTFRLPRLRVFRLRPLVCSISLSLRFSRRFSVPVRDPDAPWRVRARRKAVLFGTPVLWQHPSPFSNGPTNGPTSLPPFFSPISSSSDFPPLRGPPPLTS